MALAHNIRYLRKKQGWGQDTLAEKLGYKSYTTIQKWESGVSEPPLKVVHALAELFGVDIDELTSSDLEFGQNPSGTSERDILDEVDIAFYGDYKELDEDDKETLRAMARVMRERRAKRNQEK
jgi:transcriptional regulator with XRE-family HTH domain